MLASTSRLWAALIFSLVLSPAMADKCAAPPLNIPYRNVSLAPGIVVRGIPIQLGEPWQQIALAPSLQLDSPFIPRFTNTCVHNADMPMPSSTPNNSTKRSVELSKRDGHPGAFEENGGEAHGNDTQGWEASNWWVRCGELYGGGYTPNASKTVFENGTNNGNQQWWLNREGFKSWEFVTETWRFTDYVDLYLKQWEAIPQKMNLSSVFIVPDEGALFAGLGASMLGLTPGSSLVQALNDAKMSPSKSWALTNESLCLGCIDAAASTGVFQTFTPASRDADPKLPCLLQAKVQSLTWHPQIGGEGATLIKSTFTACIDPGVSFLVLPTEARSAFKGMVDRDVKAEYEDYIAFRGPPKDDIGILTFKFEGGLEVNVTVPGAGDPGTDKSGEWKVPIGKGGWGAYGNETWTLGRPFTDRVVLRWDAGKNEYGLANVNDDGDRKEDIKPLGCDDFPKVDKSVETTPGTGTIVGSVIGGFVGGLIFAMAGLWFFQRGQKGVKSKYEPLGDTVPMATIPTSDRHSYMSGGASGPPPAASIRESLRSQMSSRAGDVASMNSEPQLVADNAVYEAPEGGTAFPNKRERVEMWSPPLR